MYLMYTPVGIKYIPHHQEMHFSRLHMYVYRMYVSMHEFMYACLCVCVCMCVEYFFFRKRDESLPAEYIYIYIYIYECLYAEYVYIYIYECVYACMHESTYVCT